VKCNSAKILVQEKRLLDNTLATKRTARDVLKVVRAQDLDLNVVIEDQGMVIHETIGIGTTRNGIDAIRRGVDITETALKKGIVGKEETEIEIGIVNVTVEIEIVREIEMGIVTDVIDVIVNDLRIRRTESVANVLVHP